jgi:plasmid stability protein
MSSFTLKNVPETLMNQLRQRAQRNRRSLAKEMQQLLETALEASEARETTPRYHAMVNMGADGPPDRDAQVEAWRDLCGQWQSDLDPEAEIEAIYAARTAGREVDL